MARNLLGQVFGSLTVLRRVERNKHGHYRWLCECVCGKFTEVRGDHLQTGNTTSCGCARLKHGHHKGGKKSPTYKTWQAMLDRGTNTNSENYPNWGGRGITVCDRWIKFENFLEDMGERPKGLSIDRIDNNKGYEPGNCKWSTRLEQGQNMRSNRRITYQGQTHCIAEWARVLGIHKKTLYGRLCRNLPLEKVFQQVGRIV